MGAATAGIQALAGVASTVSEREAQKAESAAVQRSLASQARTAERQARDVERRGARAEQQQEQQVRGLIGSQRAQLLASGVDPNVGTAAQLLSETRALGALDAATIRNNAARQALGLRLGREEFRSRARFEDIAGQQRARATISTGLLRSSRRFGRDLRELES